MNFLTKNKGSKGNFKFRLKGFRKWESEQPRSSELTSINGAINDLVRSLGYESRIKEQKAIMIWEKVVGKRIAAVTNPLSIKKGILKIKVKNPPWRQELTYMKEDIIKKLNDEIGDILVSDIKFS